MLSWQLGDGRADQFRSRGSRCSCDQRGKQDLLLWPRDQETEFPMEACWLSLTKQCQRRGNPPTNFWWSLFLTALSWSTCTGFPLDRQQTRNTMLRFFKEVQEEIPWEEASTLQIGSMAFPPVQCTSPQIYHCHRLLDQDCHQDSSSPSLQYRPCSLWLLVIPYVQGKLRGCRYETIEELKEAVTKVIDTLTEEDFHRSFQKLLELYYKCIAAGGDYFEGD